MGIVYAAWDDRLNRAVALKTIRANVSDPAATERLRREARAAARVNHPNICQLYDVGSEDGQFYIAMELLEGEPLGTRMAEGPLPLKEAVTIALATLSALDALHKHSIIHRDLKPSNIFLTPHGVKLLDFGLARPMDEQDVRLTTPGMLMGTPRYLAPEQLMGQPADHRGDLFAAGVVLYKIITGQPAFNGRTIPEVVHAVVYEHPPALGGSASVAAVDRIVHKAIAKRTQDRYKTAGAMADELRTAMLVADSGSVARPPRPITGLIVLPFRMLRPNPEIDFLGFSLADALTTSLSGLDSLLVRSSLTASQLATDPLDLETLGRKAEVDAVLTGTLLRADDQLRVTAQLAEIPGGTVRWSHSMVSASVRSSAAGRAHEPDRRIAGRAAQHPRPPDACARRPRQREGVRLPPANQLAYQAHNWTVARDLYRQCLDEDPRYAPAWARVARLHRVIGMYSGDLLTTRMRSPRTRSDERWYQSRPLDRSESVHRRGAGDGPGDAGDAPPAGALRERSSDPELYAGLVQACRYAGLSVRPSPRMNTRGAWSRRSNGCLPRVPDDG